MTITTKVILQNLLHHHEFSTKVVPFLKPEYFNSKVDQVIYSKIQEYMNTYNSIPTPEVVEAGIETSNGLSQDEYAAAMDICKELRRPTKTPDLVWLLTNTEDWCKTQALYGAILQSVAILDDESKAPKTAIEGLVKDALSVCFDSDVGHSYTDSVELRYQKLHEQTARLKFDIDWLNKVFGGGVPRKSLSIIMGQPGGGKSLALSHMSSRFFLEGYNVLYITLELAEERIGERIDANLFGVNVLDIPGIPLDTYKAKVQRIGEKAKGARLFIKEYPPGTISAAHLRSLMDELLLKQNFKADVVIVDYLNLMNSSRYKASSGANSYTIVKAIAEELRGLAVEREIVMLTASQYNRAGVSNSDVDMTNTSDSMGIVHTADAMVAIIRSEELDEMGQLMFKCLKTRYSAETNGKSVIGVDFGKMRLHQVNVAGPTASQSQGQRAPSTPIPTNDNTSAFAIKKKPGNLGSIQV
jgi:archaellum biogenesis ATPase FlaH